MPETDGSLVLKVRLEHRRQMAAGKTLTLLTLLTVTTTIPVAPAACQAPSDAKWTWT